MVVFFLVEMTWNVHFSRSSEWNLRKNSYMKQLENTYKSNWKLLKSLNVWNDMHDLSVFEYWDQMSCAPVGSLCTNVLSGGSCTDSGTRLSGREIPLRTEQGSLFCSQLALEGWTGRSCGRSQPCSQNTVYAALVAGSGEHLNAFSQNNELGREHMGQMGGASWLNSKCWACFLITSMLEGHIPMHRHS